MRAMKVSWARPVFRTLGACGLLALASCGGGLKLVSVTGTVTLDGKPLTRCTVTGIADASKGNNVAVSLVGRVGDQGEFTLRTIAAKVSEGGVGAPLGWYKVTLRAGPNDPELKVKSDYLDPNRTPLSIEVVEDPKPGAYDLKLFK
jgi:hypothetical protein